MAKRFTDTEKWVDPFFDELDNEKKLLWIYILDKCDHAGIYKVNLRHINFNLKSNFTIEDIKKVFNGRIKDLENGKWFIEKFIDFQYGKLEENNRVHKSVLNHLEKEGVFKPLISPLQRAKDKDKDKDKVKDKDKEKEKDKYEDTVFLTKDEFKKLVDKYGKGQVRKMIVKLDAHKGSKGVKYKSDYKAILSWVIEAVGANPVNSMVSKIKTETPTRGKSNEQPFQERNPETMIDIAKLTGKIGNY